VPYEEILYSVDNCVAIITLNRPHKMNALTFQGHEELAEAIGQAARDDCVRAIVITGAGKGFCAGDDVREIFLSPEEERVKTHEARLKAIQGQHPFPGGGHALLEINKPSIAAVNGPAVGYGCELALMCSMRIASRRASFGEIFLRVGLMPDESLMILPRVIGLAKTYEMVLTTDIIDADEAERIGLVNKVVPHEDLMAETMRLANKIAAMPPVAVRLTMEGIRRGVHWPMREFMQYHAIAAPFCAETEDHKEGARAFLEKRAPRFTGR